MFKRFVQKVFQWVFITIPILSLQLLAQEASPIQWPQEIVVEEGAIVIYQPQPEKLEGAMLHARAAVAFELKGQAEPLFSAIWFETRLETDHEERIAWLKDIKITNVRFPVEDEDDAKLKKFSALVEDELMERELQINMDNLIATLSYLDERKKSALNLQNEAPKVIFSEEPAVLISLDGAPEIRNDEGVQRVINTPFTIIQDPNDKYWYLHADTNAWYRAKDLAGQWKLASEVSLTVSLRAPKADEGDEEYQSTDNKDAVGAPPKIILVTEPTELIASTGKLEFTPIKNTDLLYVSNTDSDILLDINKQKYYILLSGRWYQSSTMEGPWTFVPGDDLPEYFALIPKESDVSNVLYAVPGTEEAEDAVMDAQLPQTATVDRNNAKLNVDYDGEPLFVQIEETSLSYASNTATSVLLFNNKYYAVDEAVWFVADRPTGIWRVATEIPAEIYQIPPSSPMYHVTFVYIYKSTPEVVYVGYTQGYTNVYIYHGTVVYGTGYWYRGWYGRYYYPRPSTWGYHVRYSPRWGWSFGLSYSHGPFRFTIGRGGWYRGGWWGPSHYRGYSRGYRHGSRVGYRAGYRAGSNSAARNNIYRTQKNRSRTTALSKVNRQQNSNKVSNFRSNNVYADRSGNVHRNNNGSWQQRTDKGWSNNTAQGGIQNRAHISSSQNKASNLNKQRASPPSNRQIQQRDLNRSHQSRQRGNTQARGSATRSGASIRNR